MTLTLNVECTEQQLKALSYLYKMKWASDVELATTSPATTPINKDHVAEVINHIVSKGLDEAVLAFRSELGRYTAGQARIITNINGKA